MKIAWGLWKYQDDENTMSTIVEKSLNALNKEGPFLEIRNVFRGWELGVPNPMSLASGRLLFES